MTHRTVRGTLGLVLLLAISLPALAQKPGISPRSDQLPLNQPIEASVGLGNGDAASFYLDVKDTVYSVTIAVADAPADLDIFVYDRSNEMITYSELLDYNESLTLSRISDPPLRTGIYRVEIVYQFAEAPIVDGRRLTRAGFELTARATALAPAATLRPGSSHDGLLTPENAMVEAFAVEVPEGAEALRIDLSDTDGDLDLFLNYGELTASPDEAEYYSESIRSTEVLVLDQQSTPPLSPGTYYLLVLDQVSIDQPTGYTVSVTAGREAPPALRTMPTLPQRLSARERALLATVEVITDDGGGSGVHVGNGYILTNWHVVQTDAGSASENVTLGVSVDHTRPPRELLQAEVVDFREDPDIALLRITGGRYGQRLPAGFELPSVAIAGTDSDGLPEIGERLVFVGYPWIGGTGSRASVTYTSGVVSGYQRTAFGLMIKSDGEINSGNSGGAALDVRYRLVGLPTNTVYEDAGQLAYIVPTAAIPEEWFSYW
ncbi:MAG: trypsin-like peptidase domain-containing protein [bacterium]